ncbi:MAG: type II toxin-antitoxin system Phd/YefM family antitoxin [Planctomycetes bacterium]|nr:type II toxin-antitoxin system Phd/YefM family antitoxin [Planctomycetota bacterium]
MRITASKLRENIYKILDQVLETGIAVEVERKGRTLRIVAERPSSKLSRLEKRRFLNCGPDEIVHCDWSGEWRP